MDWLNLSDLNGWEGKAAKDYFIYATPTMFLLDDNKNLEKIIKDLVELKGYIE